MTTTTAPHKSGKVSVRRPRRMPGRATQLVALVALVALVGLAVAIAARSSRDAASVSTVPAAAAVDQEVALRSLVARGLVPTVRYDAQAAATARLATLRLIPTQPAVLPQHSPEELETLRLVARGLLPDELLAEVATTRRLVNQGLIPAATLR